MKKFHHIFLIILVSITVACNSTSPLTPNSQQNCSLTDSTHTKHNLYQNLLDSYAQDSFVGISLLIEKPGEGRWQGASGFADIESQIEMNPCHLHHAASIIKTYIAVLILQLQEEGKLSIEDGLSAYIDPDILSRIPQAEDIRIKHLLQHRSGLIDVFEASFLLDFLNQPTKSYSMEESIRYVYGTQAAGAVDERYYYGDANYILLSMIIEKLEGNLRDVYQERIFEPLEMDNSYMIDDPSQLPEGLASSYWDRYGNGIIEEVSDYQIALTAGLEGTDGLILSPADMARFGKGLFQGNLLSQTSLTQMLDLVEIPEGQSQQNYDAYGLGMARVKVAEEEWYASFGNHVGSSAMMMYNPKHQTTVVAFQNSGTFFNDANRTRFFGYLVAELEAIAFD
ncbi:MAG: serine hydrolase domain-containing protein [Bacteroidota bacterium]